MNLTSEADLAAEFGISLESFKLLRRRRGWPHVRLTRLDIRYTDAQVEQIVASAAVVPDKSTAAKTGLTERSAARSS